LLAIVFPCRISDLEFTYWYCVHIFYIRYASEFNWIALFFALLAMKLLFNLISIDGNFKISLQIPFIVNILRVKISYKIGAIVGIFMELVLKIIILFLFNKLILGRNFIICKSFYFKKVIYMRIFHTIR
jgi:hypothetical protein